EHPRRGDRARKLKRNFELGHVHNDLEACRRSVYVSRVSRHSEVHPSSDHGRVPGRGAADCDGLNVLIRKTNPFQGKAHGKVRGCAGNMYGSGSSLEILRRFYGRLTNDVVRKRIDQATYNSDIPAGQPAIYRRGSDGIRKAQVSCYEALDTATAAVNED